MWAIMINWDKHNWFTKPEPGYEYVDESEENYTTKDKAKTWETKEEAEEAITEPWEEVVEI